MFPSPFHRGVASDNSRVQGLAISANSGIRRWQWQSLVAPRNSLTRLLVVGVGICSMAAMWAWDSSLCPLLSSHPKYLTLGEHICASFLEIL